MERKPQTISVLKRIEEIKCFVMWAYGRGHVDKESVQLKADSEKCGGSELFRWLVGDSRSSSMRSKNLLEFVCGTDDSMEI